MSREIQTEPDPPAQGPQTHGSRFPNESDAYRRARNELLAAEVALKDQRERVAALRRALPVGGEVPQDYVFREVPRDGEETAEKGKGMRGEPGEGAAASREVRLSELFAPGKDELIVIHFMFAPDAENACRMCTMWADGYDAVTPHVSDKANLVLVAKAEIGKLGAWARGRGWTRLRLLSSHDSSFNRDFHMETETGAQRPGVSVFVRDPRGVIRHTWTSEMVLLNPAHHRGIDLFTPVWNLFDLLPSGRGDWMPKVRYD
jgi:predicted dithiol-disulfide oxidoreductase (DUF899 family)